MVYLLIWLLIGVIGYKMAENKKMGPWIGFVLGTLLGLIGLAIIYFSKDDEVKKDS
jgi:hypothetical protein